PGREGPARTKREPPPAGGHRERLAVERGDAQQGREVGARPQAVHVGLAGPDVAAEQHPHAGRRVVAAGLGGHGPRRLPEHAARAVREDDGQLADPDAAERAEHDAPRGTIEQASRRRPDAGCGDRGAHRGIPPARTAAPWRKNGAPRSHRRKACQWISAIVRWVSSGCRRRTRSSERSVMGRRRRTRLVLSMGAPSWRRAIESRSRSGSARTATEYRPSTSRNGETKKALPMSDANEVPGSPRPRRRSV